MIQVVYKKYLCNSKLLPCLCSVLALPKKSFFPGWFSFWPVLNSSCSPPVFSLIQSQQDFEYGQRQTNPWEFPCLIEDRIFLTQDNGNLPWSVLCSAEQCQLSALNGLFFLLLDSLACLYTSTFVSRITGPSYLFVLRIKETKENVKPETKVEEPPSKVSVLLVL